MNKFYGAIGFAVEKETSPDVWEDVIIDRNYYGDILMNSRRWDQREYQTGELSINNRFSILSDPYIRENFHNIRYIEWMGTKWIVTSIEEQYPRLILTVGGEYHGQ